MALAPWWCSWLVLLGVVSGITALLVTLAPSQRVALVSGANDRYFNSLLTLISSVHRYPDSQIDQIIVYDLGMTPDQRSELEGLRSVWLREFPREQMAFPEMLEPKQYAWKWPFLLDASQFAEYVLWIDAGAMFWRSPDRVVSLLKRDEIFLVQDRQLVREWTSLRAREIMGVTKAELEHGRQLCAGMTGYRSNGRYRPMLVESARLSGIRDCVFGLAESTPEEYAATGIKGHRHDQSISSVLALRYGCPTQPLEVFGAFDHEHLDRDGAVIYVHRGAYTDLSSLIKK